MTGFITETAAAVVVSGTAQIHGDAKADPRFLLLIIPVLAVLVLVYRSRKVPKYVFRKLLHIVAFSLVSYIILCADKWQSVTVVSVIIAVVLWPVLALFEKYSFFPDFFAEKEPGEVKKSFVLLFSMLAVLSAVSWGIFGNKHAVVCAILMWGVGDGAAALTGIPFGKHKAHLSLRFGSRTIPLTDGKKSWEGSSAMFAAAFICGFVVMLHYGLSPARAAVISLFAAAAAAFTELISDSRYDTVTVPFAVLAALLILVRLF